MEGANAKTDPGIMALLEAGCWALGLELNEAQRAGVAHNLARTAAMAALLDPAEPAPTYGPELDGDV